MRLCREVEFRLRREPAGTGGPADIIGTIDCMYQTADGAWHLIDYKSVDEAGHSEEELTARYELQLAAYALAVEQLSGAPPLTASLVRLGPPTRAIAVSVTKKSLDAAARRIDKAISTLRGEN